jgi:nucleoside 2-deoxyribosyltransferase
MFLPKPSMKTVAICGESRFAEEIRQFAGRLSRSGVVVYVPNFYRVSGGDWNRIRDFDKPYLAAGLTHTHFHKIRIADVIFVYNQNGYVGTGTTMEIGFAAACNKPIFALSDKDDDLSRAALFQGILSDADQFLQFLEKLS